MIIGRYNDNLYRYTVYPITNSIEIFDHFGGFDKNLFNADLDRLITEKARPNNFNTIVTAYILSDAVKQRYPDITFKYDINLIGGDGWQDIAKYVTNTPVNFKNFICSFNGSTHISRRLLVSILHKQNWFNTEYSSKNFTYNQDNLIGHINDFVGSRDIFYNKFFLTEDNFNHQVNNFSYDRFAHIDNIKNLESKLTESFLHIVSETLATSYQPFVTEKMLYSIVTRGLYVSYAQPNWHKHVEQYFGFKRYTQLFDYNFDSIQNPVERLVELVSMISKFSTLSVNDWHDLYLLEQDTIEYNYNHYYSKDYLKQLTNSNVM